MKTCEKCGETLGYYQRTNNSTPHLVCYDCDECPECGHIIDHYHTCSHATAEDKQETESQYEQLARFLLH